MSKRIFIITGNWENTEKLLESIESSKFASHKTRISREFDSRKDLHPTKLKQRLWILLKTSFRKFVIQSYLFFLLFVIYNNMAISVSQKWGENACCEFMRHHQSMN